MSKQVTRLLTSFVPKQYVLELDPDRDSMKLTGTVTVTGQKVGRPSQRFTFHQDGLKVTKATITKHDKKGDQEITVTRINSQDTAQEVRLHTDVLLYPGSYTVIMTFEGEITRPMEGIYPCFFKHDGKDKVLIATQFESHYARSAFPCIDEPAAKATFDLSLYSPVGETVFANTPIKQQDTKDDKLYTTFETTPKMATYLLAFVYGELGYKEATTKDSVLVRTYATPDNVAFTDFALDAAVKCLEFYNQYYDIPYPLPKCDLVALPDFAAGAMENWGCVTFREQCLLVDPANTSLPTKQYVAMVVAHELAHMWFGDLVTMRWWTDLWLNEGFASWMEYLAIDQYYPEWQLWTQYIVDEQQPGMKLDALQNTHPVQVPINHPDEIRSIFDNISYNKGNSTLQMLATYLGPDNFRDGLRHYLKKHAYGNTDTVDLWEALETVSHRPVKSFMHAWTTQPGHPLVRATVSSDSLHLEQEQFLLDPLSRNTPVSQLWPVPLGAGKDLPEVFETKEATYPLTNPDELKLNREQSGFYRVVYDKDFIPSLTKRISDGAFGPLDRLGLLADAFEAAKAGYSDTGGALQLMEAYRHEDNNAVWDVMTLNLGAIRAIMDDEQVRQGMKPYVRTLSAEQLARLGWAAKPNEAYFDSLLRPMILGLNAVSDEPGVVKEALKRFETMNKSEDIEPDLRGLVYTTAAREGNVVTFDKLFHLYSSTNSSEERVTLAVALTDFKQPELIDKALSLITTDAVRLQDVPYWVVYSFSNRFAREATWEWMVKNWDWLEKNLGNDLSFARIPLYATRGGSSADFLKQYRAFFDKVSRPGLERSIRQGIETIEWQSEWRRRDLDTLRSFFKNNN